MVFLTLTGQKLNTSPFSTASMLVICKSSVLFFLQFYMPRGHCKLRGNCSVEMFLKSAVSPPKMSSIFSNITFHKCMLNKWKAAVICS